jgi:hypothetical protein
MNTDKPTAMGSNISKYWQLWGLERNTENISPESQRHLAVAKVAFSRAWAPDSFLPATRSALFHNDAQGVGEVIGSLVAAPIFDAGVIVRETGRGTLNLLQAHISALSGK